MLARQSLPKAAACTNVEKWPQEVASHANAVMRTSFLKLRAKLQTKLRNKLRTKLRTKLHFRLRTMRRTKLRIATNCHWLCH